MYYFVNQEKYCQICKCPVWFYFTWLGFVYFCRRLKNPNYKSQWNILVFYDQWKVMSDLNTSHGKMSDFVSIPLFGFTLVIKLRNVNFESHWNILIFFDKERYGVRFECIPWKNTWFCFFSIVWVHFSQKPEKFWYLQSLKWKMSDFVSFSLFIFIHFHYFVSL